MKTSSVDAKIEEVYKLTTFPVLEVEGQTQEEIQQGWKTTIGDRNGLRKRQ